MEKIHILIVEDEFIVARDLQAHLEGLGYAVSGRASSGEKALNYLQAMRVDLVLMDITLKGKMTGIETATIIRSQFQIPVIYVTANTNPSIVEQAKIAEPFGFMVKPFHERELHANIEMGLYKHRMEQQLRESERQLQSLNAELEQRVEARTAELQDANRVLDASLRTLQSTQVQLIQAEKMAALGDLVAGITHELNTPLGISVTAASYLEEQTRDIEARYQEGALTRSELEHYLGIIREAAHIILGNLRHAAEHVQSFKQMAVDQGSEKKRTFRLKTYLNDVLLSLRPKLKKTRHTVLVNCSEDLELDSYPGVFSQIITNLITNSLIHAFEYQDEGEIMITVSREVETLTISYRDNGRGMTTEEQAHLFEPFYTTKHGQGGSGLGLHIVHTLVTQRLQGQIRCESRPGKGTTFSIQIPFRQEHQRC